MGACRGSAGASGTGRRTAVVIAPHPDDETLACGGTIVHRLRAGWRVVVVFVTDGRRSHAQAFGIYQEPSPAELAVIRRGEARGACSVLGIAADDLVFLGVEASALAWGPVTATIAPVKRAIRDAQPVSELFMPHPSDGHATHRATHAVVKKALSALGLSPVLYQYLVWSEGIDEPCGSRVDIDIAEVLPIKRAAIDRYTSQVALLTSAQEKPVLAEAFLARFRQSPIETFWR